MAEVKAYLAVTMTIDPENREAAAKVYTDYRQPFLDEIEGALTKELLIRDEDVQVLHGFDSMAHAKAYLESDLFTQKVALGLQPTWAADPDIRFYDHMA
jgi:quinol monooxygenase YgiN